jgi:dihydrodipicolinate synthase/N-acetylneuraminate lyase
MSAILLPFDEGGEIDWSAFEAHVGRTAAAGLTPAVNMDTGYVQLLSAGDKATALRIAKSVTGSTTGFVAGAFVADGAGDGYNAAATLEACNQVLSHGGTPVVFPSHGLNSLDDAGWVASMEQLGKHLDRFIGFELGAMFVPYGRIVGLDAYRALMGVQACIGAKHSSLSREAEWERLALRDEVRPDFVVFTGNDLAIDMVVYGSDYLLGLSTFAPDLFAIRDHLWADGDGRFWEVNDLLQYLGMFAFRQPVPGYRHSAAMFLKLRGWANTDRVPEGASRRPDSDRAVLVDIAERVERMVSELS